MTTAAELREFDDDQLLDNLGDSKQELFNLRFQLVTGQFDNNAEMKKVRREIARIHTILREREIAAAEALVTVEEIS